MLASGGESIQTPPTWGDCDSPGRSSGDAGAATPQVSSAERLGGVVGGAHGVGVPGSLASASRMPSSRFFCMAGKPKFTRKGGATRESSGIQYLGFRPDPGSPAMRRGGGFDPSPSLRLADG